MLPVERGAAKAALGGGPLAGRGWGRLFLVAACLLAAPAFGYDANGVALGATEAEVRTAFPSAHCRVLEWKSAAAERRCDDAQVVIAGAPARVTFYLKADRVQAFDVRFEERDLKRVTEALKQRYGAPLAESRDTLTRREGEARTITRVRWEKGEERAVLTSQEKRKRVDLNVWRGTFDEEIYRVR
jgi:hypothetical protein